MSESDLTTPFDWHRFWTEADGDRRRSAHVGQYGKADLLAQFFETRGVPDSVASFGCGPAACPIELATRYPETAVHGYDAAPSAIAEARERIADRGLENVTVAVDHLPEPNVDRSFDLVYCYATLHYVDDVETALRELFARVADGGHLVFNYPNRLTLSTYRRLVRGEADRPLPGDPDDFRERYRLVFAERNLLSYDRVETILGRRPRSFWSVVERPDAPWIGRDNPLVYVRN
ncbi:trans-aconitate 2-methyltransferase [Halovivax sp.]|uniref:class I SAM-dependent methyltransferase n=1 Tax=Halovivax sp. TaxID=1935978 RepID=UPI0025C71F91|nr:class I SAM-dependent methyltransferase [Halovivax sp.]